MKTTNNIALGIKENNFKINKLNEALNKKDKINNLEYCKCLLQELIRNNVKLNVYDNLFLESIENNSISIFLQIREAYITHLEEKVRSYIIHLETIIAELNQYNKLDVLSENCYNKEKPIQVCICQSEKRYIKILVSLPCYEEDYSNIIDTISPNGEAIKIDYIETNTPYIASMFENYSATEINELVIRLEEDFDQIEKRLIIECYKQVGLDIETSIELVEFGYILYEDCSDMLAVARQKINRLPKWIRNQDNEKFLDMYLDVDKIKNDLEENGTYIFLDNQCYAVGDCTF